MIAFRIPKPISLIGELTNKCISISSCNFFTCVDFSLYIEEKNLCSTSKSICDFLIKNRKLKKKVLIEHFFKDRDKFNFSKVYSCVFGGLNYVTISNDLWYSIEMPHKKEFVDHLLIYGIKKDLFEFDESNTLNIYQDDNIEKMVADFYTAYQESNWKFIGSLMNSYWKIKRSMHPSFKNGYIDRLYSDCVLNGAYGGKLDGSTMIIVAPPESHEKLRSIMSDHQELRSQIDMNGIMLEDVFDASSNCCKEN